MNTDITDARNWASNRDLLPYLTNAYRRLGYHTTNVVFVYLPVVYFLASWKGGTL